MAATLDASEVVGDVLRHRLPAFQGPIVGASATTKIAAHGADSPSQQRKRAYAEGFEQGRARAYLDTRAELERQAHCLQKLCEQLAAPLAAVDESVVESVAELAVLIARHLVRRELRHDPGEVVGVVRETMRQLPLATRRARIHLHPDDAELVQQALSIGPDTAWQLEPDPLINRGGCVVETESSRIDATVEARLAAIASKMFGGERGSDRAR
ncbi:MAG: flagellar assembly protein FliH [Gammaproteobacteria bacterium]|nr:flagellar assembly protein FliH [Gammaproteobacteria bacterium]